MCNDRLDREVTRQMIHVLNFLCFLLTFLNFSDKKRQKLLRNYGTIELLIQMLRTPFKEYAEKRDTSAV